MIVKELSLTNFRNYESLHIEFNKKINIIYGQNAQGKTNLLESIYFLGMTKSHRNTNDADLLRNQASFFRVDGIVETASFPTRLEIIYDSSRKKYKIDGKEEKKFHEYVTNMSVVLFSPDDLKLIKDGPEYRRNFLNSALSQLYSSYGKVLSDYNKLLKTRNDTLKKIAKQELVDITYVKVLTTYFINKAALLYRMRKKFVDKLNEYVGKIFYDITGNENFFLVYVPNIPIDDYTEENIIDLLNEKICESEIAEIKIGNSLFGPHRDEIDFFLGEKNLKKYGSQGQQRAAVLSLKFAQIQLFEKYKGEKPILLLDDVFSELDDVKKNNLLELIDENIQTIITTTDLKNIDEVLLKEASLFKVSDGTIEIEEVI